MPRLDDWHTAGHSFKNGKTLGIRVGAWNRQHIQGSKKLDLLRTIERAAIGKLVTEPPLQQLPFDLDEIAPVLWRQIPRHLKAGARHAEMFAYPAIGIGQ